MSLVRCGWDLAMRSKEGLCRWPVSWRTMEWRVGPIPRTRSTTGEASALQKCSGKKSSRKKSIGKKALVSPRKVQRDSSEGGVCTG